MGIFGTARSSPGKLGCFGKLPTYGDFMSLNADAPEAQALVNWMQAGVAAMPPATTSAGDQVIHFVWQPEGTRRTLLGALWPSSDAAGRRFPFALFTSVAGGFVVKYGPRAIIAAEGAWRAMHDVYALALGANKPAEQYGVFRDTAMPAPNDAREVNRAYVDRTKPAVFRREDMVPVALHLSDVIHFAESIGGAEDVPPFAVRMRLHGSSDPDVEAITWLHVLCDRLGFREFDSSLFLRLSRTEESALVALHRPLRPEDLGFLLAPAANYRQVDHVGYRVAATGPGDAGFIEGFQRACSNRPPSCTSILAVGAQGWTPGDLSTGPVDLGAGPGNAHVEAITVFGGETTVGGVPLPVPSPAPPPPAPAPITAPQPMPLSPRAVVTGPEPDTQELVTSDIQQVLYPMPTAREPSTGALPAPEAFPPAQSPPTTSEAATPTTAPTKQAESTTSAQLQPLGTAPLVERLEALASKPLLRGVVARIPLPTGDAVVHVGDDGVAMHLAGGADGEVAEIERQTRDHTEARRLLAELTRIHHQLEERLGRAVDEACARSKRPG